MPMLVQLVGIATAVLGIFAAGRPEVFRAWLQVWEEGERLRVAGLLKAIAGVVLVAGANATRLPTAITVFGALAVLGGLAAALLGSAPMRGALAWWQRRPALVFRAWGVLAAAIGLLVVFASR